MYSFYHPVEKTTKTSKHEASQDSIFCTLDRYKSNPCKESKEILTQRRQAAGIFYFFASLLALRTTTGARESCGA